jgi:hypothetical protein
VADLRTDATPAAETPPADRRPGPAAFVVAVLLLVAAVLVNVVQFRAIDARNGTDSFDAVHRFGTGDLTELQITLCETCQDRYGLHLSLYMVAPGSHVIVPRSGPYGASRYLTDLLDNRLYSLGRVESVEWVDDQPAELGVDPRPYIVASGPGGSRGAPWALAVQSPPAPDADPDGFLVRGLQEGRHRNPDGPPREFVLLRWSVPRPGSDREYQDLLLETSLLPAPAREELHR